MSNQLKLAQSLVGKKIVMARYLMDKEKVEVGMDHERDPVIIIILQDNTQIMVQSDPEGNGAGRISVVHPDNTSDLF